MQRGFTKLFNTIVTSTIWQEDDKTRIVWITMLAIADAFGNVFAAIPGLASVANVSIEACEKAVENLLAPDPYSRTRDFEGRRIEVIDGGWHILNYGKYRKMMDEEERREYKAKWAREKRRQTSTNVDRNGQMGTPRRPCGHRQRQSTEEEGVLPLTPSRGKPSLGEVVAFFDNQLTATEFWEYYESNGWRVGRNPMKNWQAAANRWKRQNCQNPSKTITTKYDMPLPKGCTIRRDGEVLDYTGRVMDVNQVRRAIENEKLSQVE